MEISQPEYFQVSRQSSFATETSPFSCRLHHSVTPVGTQIGVMASCEFVAFFRLLVVSIVAMI